MFEQSKSFYFTAVRNLLEAVALFSNNNCFVVLFLFFFSLHFPIEYICKLETSTCMIKSFSSVRPKYVCKSFFIKSQLHSNHRFCRDSAAVQAGISQAGWMKVVFLFCGSSYAATGRKLLALLFQGKSDE